MQLPVGRAPGDDGSFGDRSWPNVAEGAARAPCDTAAVTLPKRPAAVLLLLVACACGRTERIGEPAGAEHASSPALPAAPFAADAAPTPPEGGLTSPGDGGPEAGVAVVASALTARVQGTGVVITQGARAETVAIGPSLHVDTYVVPLTVDRGERAVLVRVTRESAQSSTDEGTLYRLRAGAGTEELWRAPLGEATRGIGGSSSALRLRDVDDDGRYELVATTTSHDDTGVRDLGSRVWRSAGGPFAPFTVSRAKLPAATEPGQYATSPAARALAHALHAPVSNPMASAYVASDDQALAVGADVAMLVVISDAALERADTWPWFLAIVRFRPTGPEVVASTPLGTSTGMRARPTGCATLFFSRNLSVRASQAGEDGARRAVVVRWQREPGTIVGRAFSWDGRELLPLGAGQAPDVLEQCPDPSAKDLEVVVTSRGAVPRLVPIPPGAILAW